MILSDINPNVPPQKKRHTPEQKDLIIMGLKRQKGGKIKTNQATKSFTQILFCFP